MTKTTTAAAAKQGRLFSSVQAYVGQTRQGALVDALSEQRAHDKLVGQMCEEMADVMRCSFYEQTAAAKRRCHLDTGHEGEHRFGGWVTK